MPDLHVTFAGTDLRCDTGRRRITGMAVPYGVMIRHGWYDRLQFQPGSIRWNEASRVKLLVDHDQSQPVGYATAIEDTPAGLRVAFTVPDGDAGDRALADASRGLRDGLSVGVALDGEPDRDSGLVTGHLREVSLCAIPAFDSARVTDVAASATPTTRQESPVPDVIEATDIAPVDLAPIHDQFTAVRDEIVELRGLIGPATPARHPLAAFKSLGDYDLAVFKGDADPNLLSLAIADQITSDNPGVLPPSWASDIKGIVNLGRAAITAFGVESAGASGMDFHWPYFDGDLSTIVGEQTTEKTDITSVKVSFKKGAASLKTWAAGSDVSYQLRDRSAPSYIAGLLRVYAAAWALATDNAFVDALVAASGTGTGTYPATDSDGLGLSGALFAASVDVQAATGRPAEFALAATDVFKPLGGKSALINPAYNPTSAAGVQSAATLRVTVNGLPVYHDANLAAGTVLVSNTLAASWIEDGPRTADAQVPLKLGYDIAMYSYGAPAVYIPKGIVKLTQAAGA